MGVLSWPRLGRYLGAALALAASLAVFAESAAGSGCEICHVRWYMRDSYCVTVPPDATVGVTNCHTAFDVFGGNWDCFEEGNACGVTTSRGSDGGGGRGAVGGGDTCTNSGGGCSAECFSCRPAV